MTTTDTVPDLALAARDVLGKIEHELGVSGIERETVEAAGRAFLKLRVGRNAPIYDYAIHSVQKQLQEDHPFRGQIGLRLPPSGEQVPFPESLEAKCLDTLLTRATRRVVEGSPPHGFSVPYVAFPNGEDHKIAQPASHLVTGRRGVGKSTLISRARDLLRGGTDISCALDMQAYAELSGEPLAREVLHDLVRAVAADANRLDLGSRLHVALGVLAELSGDLLSSERDLATGLPALKRALGAVTAATGGNLYVFFDDFHVISESEQPDLLHRVHGVLKGAGGWLKVAGLASLVRHYDPRTRRGIQVPGDAQRVSLDLTLENPRAAETHLQSILGTFLQAVGFASRGRIIVDPAFRRLVWANAGVPRDFLQMFARSTEHARRHQRRAVTLSDVNMAIGEFGQQRLDEMRQDARNEQGKLEGVLRRLEHFCLDSNGTNAFLVKSDQSEERRCIQVLSDLRLVHLIHPSITPSRAGQRYEAYILDYTLFTGFRRRRNVREMVPERGRQFKTSQLRKLPRVAPEVLA